MTGLTASYYFFLIVIISLSGVSIILKKVKSLIQYSENVRAFSILLVWQVTEFMF